MKYDLHVHSTLSDGELTPKELLDICHNENISVISITDHNNIMGAKQAIKYNIYSDITIIPGIEFAAKSSSDINLHILGYNINLKDIELNSITKAIMEDSIKRTKSLLSELKKNYNITFKDEDIKEVFSQEGNIGRPEIAKLCVKYGYVSSVHDAFKTLFNPVRDKIVKKKVELTDIECINYITRASGIASLAHPCTLRKSTKELREYIYKLANAGLEAVEVYHSNNPYDLTQELLQITQDFNLYQSLGSDFHGPIVSPGVKIACGLNNNISGKNASILTKLLGGEKNVK